MSSVPDRGDIDEQYRWELGSLYESDQEWEDAYERVAEEIDELAAFEGRLTEDPTTLANFFDEHQAIMRQVKNVYTYARLRSDENTQDSDAQAMETRAKSLYTEAQTVTSFIEPELQELTDEEAEALLAEEPQLEQYEHYIDDVLRQKPHTRSEEVEALLSDLGEVTGAPGEIYNMLANADMTFPTVEGPDGDDVQITLSNFTTHLKDPDREFRQRVYEAYFDEWGNVRNAVGTAYRNSVKKNEKLASARNYDTAREAALDDTNIPTAVYDTLVDTVRDNLDALHRHANLKQDVVGADDLQMWDLYVPLVEDEGPEIPYEDACEYVIDAVEPLGEEYQSRLAEGLDSRWVDVYETDGKRSGAYSSGTYDSQPYILMNYQDDISSMFTLAHELGHSMHSELASESQPYVYASYSLFIAEIASTVNETLLTHHLLETLEDDHLRKHVLNEYLERFRSTLFRQTMFAEFEHRAHQRSQAGEPLTSDALDDLFAEIKGDYYEPATLDDSIAREWMRIPHFYRAFYVFQYSTGISAAVSLVESIREEGEPAAKRYRQLLRDGSHGYPLDILNEAGVDLTEPAPIQQAIDVYDETLDEMESLL
ncbi:oligopeptidase F. Metallo peptidase. MEROPS family M03B [Halovenus aranensis]|uniref:Oligopeptidase F. Metallo peptidase. MEROPS family M03B n=1 Tax=Halovenus aranensis TaxID=890420 RepID=A0A1G8V6X2_9EURY|nr:oligoendopeptidase F [Halovenus aranensis]SDJ61798.1 oligopeptidase F. Metallo peptidase. MEROPS family M03B [Halovenus aranensis]